MVFVIYVGWFLALLGSAQATVLKEYSGDLSFRYQDFSDSIGDVEGNRWWGEFNFNYDNKTPFVNSETHIDGIIHLNDADGLFWSVREAQYSSLGNHSQWSVGIVLINWSEIDRIWGLGKINNRVNIDFFNPGQSGLPGFKFGQRFAKSFEVELFGSFLYIPELNPGLDIDKEAGTITSRSPWSIAPANTYSPETGITRNLLYRVDVPSTSEILFHYSFGLNLKYSLSERTHLDLFYLRKPENSLSNTARLEVDPDLSFNANVFVDPKLYYHDVWGGQLAFETSTKALKLYASYLTARPGSKPQNENDQEAVSAGGYPLKLDVQQEDYLGWGGEYKFLNGIVHLGALHRLSSFNDENVLSKTPRWDQAVNFSLAYELYTGVNFFTELFYDYGSYDRLLSGSMAYQLSQSMALTLGFAVLTSPTGGAGFWEPFKKNDAAYAKMAFLF